MFKARKWQKRPTRNILHKYASQHEYTNNSFKLYEYILTQLTKVIVTVL